MLRWFVDCVCWFVFECFIMCVVSCVLCVALWHVVVWCVVLSSVVLLCLCLGVVLYCCMLCRWRVLLMHVVFGFVCCVLFCV